MWKTVWNFFSSLCLSLKSLSKEQRSNTRIILYLIFRIRVAIALNSRLGANLWYLLRQRAIADFRTAGLESFATAFLRMTNQDCTLTNRHSSIRQFNCPLSETVLRRRDSHLPESKESADSKSPLMELMSPPRDSRRASPLLRARAHVSISFYPAGRRRREQGEVSSRRKLASRSLSRDDQ